MQVVPRALAVKPLFSSPSASPFPFDARVLCDDRGAACRENAKVVVADLSDGGKETVDLIAKATGSKDSAIFVKTDVSKVRSGATYVVLCAHGVAFRQRPCKHPRSLVAKLKGRIVLPAGCGLQGCCGCRRVQLWQAQHHVQQRGHHALQRAWRLRTACPSVCRLILPMRVAPRMTMQKPRRNLCGI